MMILLLAVNMPDSQAAKLVTGSFARLSTLWSTNTLGESSLQWRFIENEYALTQIISHPLLGIGLGANYRPWDPRIDHPRMGWDARGFIHNGHLWTLLKTGLLGYVSLMWLSVVFLIRGFRYWRSISNLEMRGIMLGFTLAYMGLLIAAIVNGIFRNWIWTPVIGIMMGFNEVVLRYALQK
jgi:O-antigen ligase